MFLQTHERGWWTKPNPNANPKLGQRDQRAPSAAALTRVSDFMGKDKKKKTRPLLLLLHQTINIYWY